MPNYKLFQNDGGRGGGVCIYVRNTIKTNVITLHEPDKQKPQGNEDLFLTVQHCMLPATILGCIYRHPKAPADSSEYICNTFQSLCISKKNFFILGDLNDDLVAPGSKLNKIIKKQ